MGLYTAPGYVIPGYINDGPMPSMPNVVGVNWQQATGYLIQAGITPNNALLPGAAYVNVGYFDVWPVYVNWISNSGQPPGIVIAQSPAYGTQVAFDSVVTLTVANYPMGVADLYSAGGNS